MGFEAFFDYASNFIHLNINLGNSAACRKYHDNGMSRYRRAAATWSDYDVAVWAVRLRAASDYYTCRYGKPSPECPDRTDVGS